MNTTTIIIIASVVGGCLLLIVVLAFIVVPCIKRGRDKKKKPHHSMDVEAFLKHENKHLLRPSTPNPTENEYARSSFVSQGDSTIHRGEDSEYSQYEPLRPQSSGANIRQSTPFMLVPGSPPRNPYLDSPKRDSLPSVLDNSRLLLARTPKPIVSHNTELQATAQRSSGQYQLTVPPALKTSTPSMRWDGSHELLYIPLPPTATYSPPSRSSVNPVMASPPSLSTPLPPPAIPVHPTLPPLPFSSTSSSSSFTFTPEDVHLVPFTVEPEHITSPLVQSSPTKHELAIHIPNPPPTPTPNPPNRTTTTDTTSSQTPKTGISLYSQFSGGRGGGGAGGADSDEISHFLEDLNGVRPPVPELPEEFRRGGESSRLVGGSDLTRGAVDATATASTDDLFSAYPAYEKPAPLALHHGESGIQKDNENEEKEEDVEAELAPWTPPTTAEFLQSHAQPDIIRPLPDDDDDYGNENGAGVHRADTRVLATLLQSRHRKNPSAQLTRMDTAVSRIERSDSIKEHVPVGDHEPPFRLQQHPMMKKT